MDAIVGEIDGDPSVGLAPRGLTGISEPKQRREQIERGTASSAEQDAAGPGTGTTRALCHGAVIAAPRRMH